MLYLKEILGGKCVLCGSINKLQFDHRNPDEKVFTIGSKWSYSIEYLKPELDKCQLLCSDCHKQKNKIDNGEAVHGSISMYRYHRCRCDECKKTWNLKCMEWRRK